MSPRQASQLTVEHILLALLDGQSKHGYELHQELAEMQGISQIWFLKQALMYAILDKLEERGYVTSELIQGESYPPRKYFHLTPLGKESLHHWLKTPVRRARDIRQEFLAKLIIAHRYGRADVLELVQMQEETCLAWQRDLQNNIPALDLDHLDEWLVYSFRKNRMEAELKWIKEVDQAVNRLL